MKIVIFVIGVIVGSIVSNLISIIFTPSSTLEIDHTDPNKDSYSFYVGEISDLGKRRNIRLRVKHVGKQTQK